jgi:hypothetical protein
MVVDWAAAAFDQGPQRLINENKASPSTDSHEPRFTPDFVVLENQYQLLLRR